MALSPIDQSIVLSVFGEDTGKHICQFLDSTGWSRLKRTCRQLATDTKLESFFFGKELLLEATRISSLITESPDLNLLDRSLEWIVPLATITGLSTQFSHRIFKGRANDTQSKKNWVNFELQRCREKCQRNNPTAFGILTFLDELPESPEWDYLLAMGLSGSLQSCTLLPNPFPHIREILKRGAKIRSHDMRTLFLVSAVQIIAESAEKFGTKECYLILESLLSQASELGFIWDCSHPLALPFFSWDDFPILKNNQPAYVDAAPISALGEVIGAFSLLPPAESLPLFDRAIRHVKAMRSPADKIASLLALIQASVNLDEEYRVAIVLIALEELEQIPRVPREVTEPLAGLFKGVASAIRSLTQNRSAHMQRMFQLLRKFDGDQIDRISLYLCGIDMFSDDALEAEFFRQCKGLVEEKVESPPTRTERFTAIGERLVALNPQTALTLLSHAFQLIKGQTDVPDFNFFLIEIIYACTCFNSPVPEQLVYEIAEFLGADSPVPNPRFEHARFYFYLHSKDRKYLEPMRACLRSAFEEDSPNLRIYLTAVIDDENFKPLILEEIRRWGVSRNVNLFHPLVIRHFSVDIVFEIALHHLRNKSNGKKYLPPFIALLNSDQAFTLCQVLLESLKEAGQAEEEPLCDAIAAALLKLPPLQFVSTLQEVLKRETLNLSALNSLAGACATIYQGQPSIVLREFMETLLNRGKDSLELCQRVIGTILAADPQRGVELIFQNRFHKGLLSLLINVPESFWLDHSRAFKLYATSVLRDPDGIPLPRRSLGKIVFLIASLQGQNRAHYDQFISLDRAKKMIPLSTIEKTQLSYEKALKGFSSSDTK